ncbi:MAG: starvation-sensing protein RspA [Clostridiales bacterium]|nr:starvation-sensing protein RspA [Clostridiales bacterium]
MSLKITRTRAIATAPAGIPLVVVRVETNEPGLYGLGCATFTQRWKTVVNAVEEYMDPFLRGKDPRNIEDVWHTAMVSAYWRNGPVLNNALSGVDMALWDIAGKLASMPVYALWGGKCREGVAVYTHAGARELPELMDRVQRMIEEGFFNIRCQLGRYGGEGHAINKPDGAPEGAYYDPNRYVMETLDMMAALRERFGYDVRFLHDVHERLPLVDALYMAREMERYRLLFLEDLLQPEQVDGFRLIRSACATPLAMGELFNHPLEWRTLVTEKLIDFIRVHVSQIGGVTPARKLAALCECFGVRTAWHGPGDVSPVGHVANLHLDIACPNFGVQEWSGLRDPLPEVFPGCPELRRGYVYVNDQPGWGIDIDEEKAARYTCPETLPMWTMARWPDGTSFTP